MTRTCGNPRCARDVSAGDGSGGRLYCSWQCETFVDRARDETREGLAL